MESDEFVEAYGGSIEAGQASLLIGAGLSAGAGYPIWSDLIDHVAECFEVPEMDDLPLRSQYIENQIEGKEALCKHIASTIKDVKPSPLPNHYLISRLKVSNLWTTNYDALIETADKSLDVIRLDRDLTNRRDPGVRRLNKMHGSVWDGESCLENWREQLVWSRDDYDRYEFTHPRLWRLLQAQFLTSSFCFIGFSMTDPNFEAIFRIARLATPNEAMPHYAVMKRSSEDDPMFDFRARDLKRAGINLVEISEYNEITLLLKRLLVRTKPPYLAVFGSYRSPSDGEVSGTDPYPTATQSDELKKYAAQLGEALAEKNIPGIVTAGEVGAEVGYAFLENLNTYDPNRFVFVRRKKNSFLDPSPRRMGQILFVGEEPTDVRGVAYERARVVVILGGGPGTESEASKARESGMGVVPVAATGGAAKKVWDDMSAELSNYQLGLKTIDKSTFNALADEGTTPSIEAAVTLIRQGLSLPSGE